MGAEWLLEVFEYELKISGRKKYFEARMAKLPDSTKFMLIVRDISKQVFDKERLEFQSTLLDQSLAATDVVNEHGVFSYVNNSYAKMWGYETREEIMGTSPIEHCFDPQMPQKIIEKVNKEQEATFSFKGKRKDNSTFNALMAVKCVFFKDKKFYIGSTLDITEKEKFARQYETMFNNAREGIFLHELDGRIIDVNPYIEELQGLSKEKIIGTNIGAFFKKEDANKLKRLIKKLFLKGHIEFQMELLKLDGTRFYASIESHLIELDGRKIAQGTIKDLTEELNTQLLLTQSKKVFENLEEGVVITDLNGSIIEINNAFETITGYGTSEAIGNNMSMLNSGIQGSSFYRAMWKALLNDFKWSGKVSNKKKSGEIYTSFLTISTIKNKEGMVQNYIGVFTDISDVLAYEKELREKEIILVQQSKMAAMGEMIDNIAHQWKQPLGMISMLNGLIKMTDEQKSLPQGDKTILESSNNIEHEVNHLSSTINDFRNFFSPDKIRKEFLIEDSVARLLRLIRPRLKSVHIEIVQNIQSVRVEGVENEVVQVLMNVVNNAIDALGDVTEGKKYIFIDAFEEKQSLVVSIKDNAGGIPDEIAQKIFDSRFTTKEEGKGTGIGLYMSMQMMRSLGGNLSFENSEYEYNQSSYKGANFIITMPKV